MTPSVQEKASSPSSPPLITTEQIAQCSSVQDIGHLLKYGCCRCSLGAQPGLKGPVLYRGNPLSRYILVGEGPGEHEDNQGVPFVGEAGILLDRIFSSVGLSTREQFYMTNVSLCRYIAPEGSGRKNLTPLRSHLEACRPFMQRQLELLDPKVVVLLGKTAVDSLMPSGRAPMGLLAGKWYDQPWAPNGKVYVMYHPAALLHARVDEQKYSMLREQMWLHIRRLRNHIDTLEGRETIYQDI